MRIVLLLFMALLRSNEALSCDAGRPRSERMMMALLKVFCCWRGSGYHGTVTLTSDVETVGSQGEGADQSPPGDFKVCIVQYVKRSQYGDG